MSLAATLIASFEALSRYVRHLRQGNEDDDSYPKLGQRRYIELQEIIAQQICYIIIDLCDLEPEEREDELQRCQNFYNDLRRSVMMRMSE